MNSNLPIGIIGAGPAGATLGRLLAGDGFQVILMDRKKPHEKACGGGVTARGYRNRPYLLNAPQGCVEVWKTVLESGGRQIATRLPRPVLVYERRDLNRILFQAAIDAGARFIHAGARSFQPTGRGFQVDLAGRAPLEVSFLVGADGAAGISRKLLGGGAGRDRFALACGFLARRMAGDEIIYIFFPPGLPGYTWIFPRLNHLSVGICSREPGISPRALGDLLRRTLEASGCRPDPIPGTQFSFLIPDFTAFQGPRAGPGWALIGDAGGFVDPITLEGIPHALRSAEILAVTIRKNDPGRFEAAWRADFGKELYRAARLVDGFYRPGFTGHLIRMASSHPRIRALLAEHLCGMALYRCVRLNVARAYFKDTAAGIFRRVRN